MKPKTLILRTAGTNCDVELAHAFELAGSTAEAVHVNRLIAEPALLDGYDLLGIPGGFSYGDDIAAGKIFATRIRHRLYPALRRFVTAGRPIIGICNGFQLLIKTGLLPGFDLPDHEAPPQLATLTDNSLPRFVARWTTLNVELATRCIWTRGIASLDLPIAHGEGRFVADAPTLDRLEQQQQVVVRYSPNPNGSLRDIAGICDPAGRVFGLMPHPERYTHPTHHPRWTGDDDADRTMGLAMFRNAVQFVEEQAAVG